MVLLPMLALGITLGALGYAWVREMQFIATDRGAGGMSFPLLSGVVGFGVPMVLCGALGEWLARRIVRWRTPSWVQHVAARYRIPATTLAETTDLLAD